MIHPFYLVELNEINFEYVKRYSARGHLPQLSALIQRHGLGTTVSESTYDHIEPWIQWVSAHTGRPYNEHKVFRLGDIANSDLDQIWEVLERRGISVGALSPMNAVNRLANPSFFVPDPWTLSRVSADRATQALYRGVRQAVKDNAAGRLSVRSLSGLFFGFAQHVPTQRLGRYFGLSAKAAKKPWHKSVLLDELLGDLFLSLLSRHSPQFASVFLNAGAHIQHHYLFNSAVYGGDRRNPKWYVDDGDDPVLDAYTAYDKFIARLLALRPDARVVIATGLQQVPYPHETYYWRLANHGAFLTWAGIPFRSIEPLMSRDFVVRCANSDDASRAEMLLSGARIEQEGNKKVFDVDNRGDSLFCTLVFDKDVEPHQTIAINGNTTRFRQRIAFVALKNAHHDGLGYFIDTANSAGEQGVPLTGLFDRVCRHFGLSTSA